MNEPLTKERMRCRNCSADWEHGQSCNYCWDKYLVWQEAEKMNVKPIKCMCKDCSDYDTKSSWCYDELGGLVCDCPCHKKGGLKR